MEVNIETPKTNGISNGHLLLNKKSRSIKIDSPSNSHISIFDPNKYMLKLPKTKKIVGDNGQVRWEKTETDYLPVAARIAWFRKDHPYWSIVTRVEKWGDKAIVMKADDQRYVGNCDRYSQEKGNRDWIPGLHRESRNGSDRKGFSHVRIRHASSARV